MLHLKRFCALLIAASACFSQAAKDCSTTDPSSVNGYYDDTQGYNLYPGTKVYYQYCPYVYNPKNPSQRVYISGVNSQLNVYTQNGSGAHYHELDTTTPQRPSALYLSPNPTLSDQMTGCATFSVQLPQYAGWVTFDASSQFGRSGVNLCTKYWVGALGNPTYLIPYPDDWSNNKPQSKHADLNHNTQNRYLTPGVVAQVTNASEAYSVLTATMTSSPDFIDITRGSLPNGGWLDDEGPGFTPDGGTLFPVWSPWTVRKFEVHNQGVEIDVVNPYFAYDYRHTLFLNQAMNQNTCQLGMRDSSGNKLPSGGPVLYWGVKDIMHYVCRPNSLVGGQQ